ncbi:MAG: septum formation family protein [Corynebacterium sp.]|nr:septum formation family protein [Corynebacterium sp.]
MRFRATSRPVLACLFGVLVAGGALTGYNVTNKHTGGGVISVDQASGSSRQQVTPFSTADVGDCLTWDVDSSGALSDFGKTNCTSDHRFEVTARINLALYPSSQFASDAPTPDATTQAALRANYCQDPTVNYLDGNFDPVGRFSIGIILPPASAWEAGDRTMLCGLEVKDSSGSNITSQGTAKNQDQSRVAQVGECVAIGANNSQTVVDCALDHAYEVTSVVDTQTLFPQATSSNPPSVADQNQALAGICTQAALDYLGGDDALYNSTLQPFWTTRSQQEWSTGSHLVNCALAKDNRTSTDQASSFAVLAGSAKGVFTINGEVPPPQPERRPLRETTAEEAPAQ